MLLQSKLRVPPLRREVVARQRLQEPLGASPARRVTVVDAPAGFGKTTLLASWLAADQACPCAWVSLDERDADPARLLAHVREALHRAHPAVGRALPRSGAAATRQAALTALANGLETAGVPLVLVLDDCHLVSGAPGLEVLGFLVEHLPEPVRVVLAMRGEPTVPLGRLRARGELHEIRAHDLRFTAPEARELLERGFGVGLDAPELHRLVEHTEGWPAGLCLAGLSLREHPDPPAFVHGFAGDHRHVGEYLMEEVLRAEPPEVREFLVRTSLPARLSGGLCDAMLERTASAAQLAALERRNQFVIPLDEHHEWYRYHHLFADFLRGQLLAAEPELVPELHRRAARWLRASSDVNLAIRHAAAGGAYADAAEMIVSHGPLWTRHGRPATVAAWLELLPDGYAAADPQLAAGAAWHGRLTGADELAFRSYVRWAAQPDSDRPWIGVARSQTAEVALLRVLEPYGDAGETVRAARAAVRAVPRDDPGSGVALALLGLALLQAGRYAEAASALTAGLRQDLGPEHAVIFDSTLAFLAAAEAHCGRIERGRELAERSLALIERHDLVASPSIGCAFMTAAEALLAAGDAVRARSLAERAAELHAVLPSPHVTNAYAHLVLARVYVALDDHAGATRTLEAVRAALAGASDGAYVAARAAELAAGIGPTYPGRPEPLSARELDVLRLLATDLSQREIGAALFVSINTVKSHVRAILRKLAAGTRAEAVAQARRRGLID